MHPTPSTARRRRPPAALVALCAVLLATLLVPATGAAAAKAPKTPTCKPGEIVVRVAAKAKKGKKAAKKPKKARTTLRCKALPGVTGATVADASAAARKVLPSPAELRARVPKKLRKRFPLTTLKRLDRAVVEARSTARPASAFRRLSVPAARAAAAGPSGCSGQPSSSTGDASRVVDGVKLSGSEIRWGASSGPSSGQEFSTTAAVAGGKLTITQRECLTWETCPDADGKVKGRYEWSMAHVSTASKDGLSATLRIEAESTIELTGHVGDDGRVTTYDWKGAGTGKVRAEARKDGKLVAYVPAATVRAMTEQTGADPRRRGAAPQEPTLDARGLDGSVLDGTKDAQIQLAGLIGGNQLAAAKGQAPRALLEAEKVWYDQAACLTVELSPQGKEIAGGERLPVALAIKAKDGAAVPARYDLTPVDGAVGPPTGTTPATVTYTAPSQVPETAFETFKVVAVSRRGRALGTHTAKGTKAERWFKVTFTGAATYHRYEPRGLPYPQLWSDMELSFSTVMQPARFPGYVGAGQVGIWGSESVALTGQLNGRRLDGSGTSSCSGTPDASQQIGRLEVQETGDGYDLAVFPFFTVQPIDASSCGTLDDMLVWNDGVEDAMTADVRVSKADLASRDVIEIPVTPKRPIKQCDGGAVNGGWACTHTVDWSGVVKLERTAAPAGALAD